jgi:hypothetical protein
MENLSLSAANYHQAANIVSVLAVVLIVAASLAGSQVMPRGVRVPMQFGLGGKPTWFATRWLAFVFTPVCGVVCIAGLWYMTSDGPSTRPNHDLIMFVVRSFTAALWAVAHAGHMFFAARYVARQKSLQAN